MAAAPGVQAMSWGSCSWILGAVYFFLDPWARLSPKSIRGGRGPSLCAFSERCQCPPRHKDGCVQGSGREWVETKGHEQEGTARGTEASLWVSWACGREWPQQALHLSAQPAPLSARQSESQFSVGSIRGRGIDFSLSCTVFHCQGPNRLRHVSQFPRLGTRSVDRLSWLQM